MTNWAKMERKFVPKMNATMVKLMKDFGQMSLVDVQQYPDELITNCKMMRM